MEIDERRLILDRGRKAEEILDSPVLEQVFEELMLELHTGFFADEWDAENAQKQWSTGQALLKVQQRLKQYVDDAKVEAENKKYDEQ